MVSTRSISLVGTAFKSTCWPGEVAPLKRLAGLDAEGGQFLQRLADVGVTALIEQFPRDHGGRLQAVEVGARDARTGDDDFLELLFRFRRLPGLLLRLRADRSGNH